ncbi:unnamed protein product [Effrenium voratum]|uniref:Uncharacterized protein n=1 Tax=Effrenium voratum TaxID=2562239 RepID=A0AA36HRV4_9DINO|nr:unnamed protein product [Effrenium voratum]CAJ1373098.1 unnamed protein product [Effrenium voratum]CAJ1448183.1 unnamed protein product [Effrenium voratum]
MSRPLDMNKTPWNFMKQFQEATKKQEHARELFEMKQGGPRRYRFQAPGERVELVKSRSQPHLNGLSGFVDFSNADELGFLKVRMPKWARTTRAGQRATLALESSGKEGYRYLKVRPQNLRPLRHPSDERPRGGTLQEFFQVEDDLASIKSCTDTVASCSERLSTARSLPQLRRRPAITRSLACMTQELACFTISLGAASWTKDLGGSSIPFCSAAGVAIKRWSY